MGESDKTAFCVQAHADGMYRAGRDVALRVVREWADAGDVEDLQALARWILDRVIVEARVSGSGASDDAVSHGLADALGLLALAVRTTVRAPDERLVGAHRPGSLPFVPTQEQRQHSALLASAEAAGLSESQVIDLLARRVEELQASVCRLIERAPGPLVVRDIGP